MVKSLFARFSSNARAKRAETFRAFFEIDEHTKILDLGSETGTNISSVLKGLTYDPKNIHIADIDSALIEEGAQRFGFTPVLIDESKPLDYEDGYFDAAIDKSTIDALLCGDNSYEKVAVMMKLKVVFYLLSFLL